MTQGHLSRRGFIERLTAALLAAGVPAWYARQAVADDQEKKAADSRRKIGPNDQIAIGLIGSGGQGSYDTKVALKQKGVRLVAVCDVHAGRRESATQEFVKEVAKNGGQLKAREAIADAQEKKAAEARKKVGPNDEIVIGLIGCGGQGIVRHQDRL